MYITGVTNWIGSKEAAIQHSRSQTQFHIIRRRSNREFEFNFLADTPCSKGQMRFWFDADRLLQISEFGYVEI